MTRSLKHSIRRTDLVAAEPAPYLLKSLREKGKCEEAGPDPKGSGSNSATLDDDLRHLPIVSVRGNQLEAVLHCRGCDPQVVCRYRRSLRPKIDDDRRVSFRRFFINDRNLHARRCEELPEYFPVLLFLAAVGKPGVQLAHHHRVHVDLVRRLD